MSSWRDEAHRSQFGYGGKVNEETGEMSRGFTQQPARFFAECVVHRFDSLAVAARLDFAQCGALSLSVAPLLPPVTGTPIEKTGENARAAFGDCI